MTETNNRHIDIDFQASQPDNLTVSHEHFETVKLDMSQTERDRSKGAHVLAAMERQFGPIDEDLTERANQVTLDNDEYDKLDLAA